MQPVHSVLFLYVVYGLSFAVLGVSLFLQARVKIGPLPNRAVWWLALFAGLHGASEWTTAGSIARSMLGLQPSWPLILSANALLFFSFCFLLAFAGELLVQQKHWPRSIRIIELIYCCVFLMAAIIFAGTASTTSLVDRLHIVESFTRYAIAFPAAILSAYGLYYCGKKHDRIYGTRLGPSLSWSAGIFVIYAIATGLLQPGVPIREPIRIFHFAANWVIGIRVFCAIVLTGLLAEAFVVEVTKYLRESDKLREEFISTVTHDIRSSISGAASAAELLERFGETGHADKIPALSKLIRASLKHANATINDLFETSVLESGRLPMRPARFDLGKLIDQLLEEMRATSVEHSFRFDIDGARFFVFADPYRVEQVLRNLLSNAAKYSPGGSQVEVRLADQARYVLVSITNSGPGIPSGEISHIFQRFYRIRGSSSAAGTGIGLYVVKQLVEASGGKVFVTSRPNDITTFTFTLPKAVPTGQHSGSQQATGSA